MEVALRDVIDMSSKGDFQVVAQPRLIYEQVNSYLHANSHGGSA
jgi:hypothetical protein